MASRPHPRDFNHPPGSPPSSGKLLFVLSVSARHRRCLLVPTNYLVSTKIVLGTPSRSLGSTASHVPASSGGTFLVKAAKEHPCSFPHNRSDPPWVENLSDRGSRSARSPRPPETRSGSRGPNTRDLHSTGLHLETTRSTCSLYIAAILESRPFYYSPVCSPHHATPPPELLHLGLDAPPRHQLKRVD